MKITINKNDEKWKEFDLPTEKLVRTVTKFGVFSFASKEIMRVRPPRRNAGVILNLMTAVAITDAVMAFADGTVFKKGPEVVAEQEGKVNDCESYSEVMGENNESGDSK